MRTSAVLVSLDRIPLLPTTPLQATPLALIPRLPWDEVRSAVQEIVAAGGRILALFGHLFADMQRPDLIVVTSGAQPGQILLGRAVLDDDRFLSLTLDCEQAHLFEREIAEQYQIVPMGHPWLKPVRFAPPWRDGQACWPMPETGAPVPGSGEFYKVEGAEIHEVAVGPVHAGVIEPGHFRFQCYGELVFHLEIVLGYQHRGVEAALIGGPHKRTLAQLETVAGDTTIGHATAYCQALEALAGVTVPERAEYLRAAALELERLANHTGDLGALAGDVAFLPTASYCGRLRGDFLNISAVLCGSRFGRGLIVPGGVAFDADAERVKTMGDRLDAAMGDLRNAVKLMWDNSGVIARFDGTGAVTHEVARKIGLVGVAARACGLDRDVRAEFPTQVWRTLAVEPAVEAHGDVWSRAHVRWNEAKQSGSLTRSLLQGLPTGAVRQPMAPLAPDALTVSLVEGWRGEICHVALTDGQGTLQRYKIIDPSFHNWMGLQMALRNQQISDFPLCNKSFNLSYCGHDL